MAEKEKPNKNEKRQIAKREEEILKFWNDNTIFKKSLEKPSPKGNFIFYDGPPFATGLPHYGHILASAIKDAVPRYKTMRGFHVDRRWGWDTHGLPIENLVEKELKVSGKKEIEALGIEKFNEHARSLVLSYVHEWKRTVERIGRWVDFDGAYMTMNNSFMESVWWALKEMNSMDLIYESTRVLPYCPRCETPIANSEIAMDNSYKDITDISVYVKFELLDELKTYVLAWTTTPWTLPGNTALAVNENLDYMKLEVESSDVPEFSVGEKFILGKDAGVQTRVFGTTLSYGSDSHPSDPSWAVVNFKNKGNVVFKNIEVMKGKELVGKSYKPIFDYFVHTPMPEKENGWKIYAAPYVTNETGTAIVHLAPNYGEEDMELARKYAIPTIHHVALDGTFIPTVTDFKGLKAKPKENPQSTDIEIIKNLAHRGILFAKEKIVHSYPHCYRCETPLLYYALPAWFVKIQTVKPRLVDLNEKIHWVPDHLKEGRFKKSMEAAPDWNISRNRFWATPLPIWICKQCGKKEFFGSLEDLKSKTRRNTYYVVRHGEGDHNVANIMSSLADNPHHLTDHGREQVTLSAQALKDKKIDIIISSPFVRTKETTDVLVEHLAFKGEIVYDDRLGEFNFGDFNLKSLESYHAYFDSVKEKLTKRLPHGECVNDLRKRMGDFMYDIDSKYQGKTIVIVTHDGPATMLFAAAEGADDARALDVWGLDRDFLSPGQEAQLDFSKIPHNSMYELDMHRPYIDEITFPCDCGGTYMRISEVIDCWFESGSMPFAAVHYPFEKKQWFHDNFPSDFVAEYIAQTRTWFYYMLSVSGMLFDEIPFKNVVTTGTVLAKDGQKMSKSKGNFPDPWILFDTYGVDAVRYYLLSSPIMRAEDLFFSEKDVEAVTKKLLMRFGNVVSFYELYKDDGVEPDATSKNILDSWIVARLNEVGKEITDSMEMYELDRALRPVETFIDDLSTWYLRRSRDRFKESGSDDKKHALATTRYVLFEFSKLLAPFMPFIAEEVYQKVAGKNKLESVHLEHWSDFNVANNKILEGMNEARTIVSLGLEQRAKTGIKVRQPLQALSLRDELLSKNSDLADLVKDEINVKEIRFDKNLSEAVMLDTEISESLKQEGQARDFIRALQEFRKTSKLNPHDVISVIISTNEEGKKLIEKFKEEIMKTAQLKDISFESANGESISVGNLEFIVEIKK